MDLHKNKNSPATAIGLIFCFIVISLIYLHTLNRPWIFYDEITIPEEIHIPISTSLGEIFEIIKLFGLGNGFSSGNLLYSSNSVYRHLPLGSPFLLIINFLLKKNGFLFHCTNLLLHLANTTIIYFLIRKCFSKNGFIYTFLTLILTLLWAIHPINTESILLSSNIGAILTYLIFFLLFYDFIKNKHYKKSISKTSVIITVYLLSIALLGEYLIVLPLVTYTYSFLENYKDNSFLESIKASLKENIPYLIGLTLYSIYFFISGYNFPQQTNLNSISLVLERIFWLSPQILIHYIKIIFYPRILTIDQSGYIMLSHSLIGSYSLFCFLCIVFLALLPLIFFILKRKCYFYTLTVSLFFISLLPFSQILSPTYCLAAERYLYMPIFLLIFGIANFIGSQSDSKNSQSKLIGLAMLILLLVTVLSVRTYHRTNDWKNNEAFLKSMIKTSPNYLYKGFRFDDLSKQSKEKSLKEKYSRIARKYYFKAFNSLKNKRYNNEPLILKSYGLDNNSLIIKSIYLISLQEFINNEKTYDKCLKRFSPYLKYFDQYEPAVLELYANLLIKNNELSKAKKIFLFAHQKYPTSPALLISLIRFYRDIEKNLPDAKKYLDKAIKLYPYSKNILFEAVRYYQLDNDFKSYINYSYLYGLRAHSKFTYLEALTGFLTLGELDKAKKTIDKLISLDKSDPKIYYFESSYFIKKKDFQSALEVLNKAHELVKTNTHDDQLAFDITYTLSALYLKLGNIQQGAYYAKEALNIGKDNPGNTEKIKNLMKQLGI